MLSGVPLMKGAPPTLAVVDGWPINIANQKQAIDEIMAAASKGDSFSVWTLNMDFIVKLRQNSAFREAFRHARFVMADGAPIVRLAAKYGVGIQRTTGADLVAPLVQAASAHRLPVYFFGTSPEVLRKASSQLAIWTNNRMDIVGTDSPRQGFDPSGPEADAALDRIKASGARLCFVALGAPKQEIFAARAVERGVGAGFLCVGAALDFIAGAQIRAPGWVQRHGLEWLWRLGSNPRRLFMRYAHCAVALTRLLAAEWLASRGRTLRS